MHPLNQLLVDIDVADARDSGKNAATARYHEASKEAAETIASRLKLADTGYGDFTVHDLLFAAAFRCSCGSGMAYPEGIGSQGAWYCSAILLGQADPGTTHTPSHPFMFYEVKSESQPSASGSTTRPSGTHLEHEISYVCVNCGIAAVSELYRKDDQRDVMKTLACGECGERYINPDGSSNSKIKTRYFHTVVSDESDEIEDPKQTQ